METLEPRVWSVERLLAEDLSPARVWATGSVRARTESVLPHPHTAPLAPLAPGTRTLIVVGGGTLIDAAKIFRHEHAPEILLIVIPSLWGSGAESSPVAISDEGGRKLVRMGPEFLPDVRVRWPELADSIPPRLAKSGCGDALAHAIEGFLSPLSSNEISAEMAPVLSSMLDLPIEPDPRWFEPSASACRIQARSSVGLVHGIAHTLEGPLRALEPDFGWGHARLCATFLWPVLSLNLLLSGRASERFAAFGLDAQRIARIARSVFDEDAYTRALPLLETHWGEILHDRCTRTNSVLIRPGQVEHFRHRLFAT